MSNGFDINIFRKGKISYENVMKSFFLFYIKYLQQNTDFQKGENII